MNVCAHTRDLTLAQATAAAPTKRGGLAASRFANAPSDDDAPEKSTDPSEVEGEDDDPYSVAVASVRTYP
jgi:hypothetical protein